MTARRAWVGFAALLLAPAPAGLAADADRYGDPLPEGAVARLGPARLRFANAPHPVLTPDGKALYAAGPGGRLLALDPATGAAVGNVPAHPPGELLALSADGRRALSTTFRGGAVVWDTGTGKELLKQGRPTLFGEGAAGLSADGRLLALSGAAEPMNKGPVTAVVWDVDAGKEVAAVAVPQNRSARVAISADGRALATWGEHYVADPKPAEQENSPGKFVVFWSLPGGKELSRFRVGGYAPQAVAFGPGGLAAVSGGNNTVDLVDPATGTSKHQLLGRSRMGRYLTFSPDGATVAAAGDDGAVMLWRTADGARAATVDPPAPDLYARGLRLLDGGRGRAWGTRGAAVVVWEVPSGKPLGPVEGHTQAVTALAVTADGRHALTSAVPGTILRWELAAGELRGEAALKQPGGGHRLASDAAVLSRDGTRALVRDAGGADGLFDLATGSELYALPGGPSLSDARRSFSADGSRVVVVPWPSEDPKKGPTRAAVYEAATGKRAGAVELTGYAQLSAAVTPDGKHLVTAGTRRAATGPGEFAVTGWELATGAKKGEWVGPSAFSTAVEAAADNRTAAVVAADGRAIAVDVFDGKRVREFDTRGYRASGLLALSADGRRLAVACDAKRDGTNSAAPALVFDWATGELLRTLPVPGEKVSALLFTPDGKRLLTSAADTSVLVWDVSK